jgi:hypothetical protein
LLVNSWSERTRARDDGGTLSFRWNAPGATPFASVTFPDDEWQTLTTHLPNPPSGTGKLYVTSNGGVFVDSFEFVGDGIDRHPLRCASRHSPQMSTKPGELHGGNISAVGGPLTVRLDSVAPLLRRQPPRGRRGRTATTPARYPYR